MPTRARRTVEARSVTTLQDLLHLDGAEFVRTVYQTFLQRDADAAGFVAYLDKLSQGLPKRALIDQIRNSPEGRMRAVVVPGLDDPDDASEAATDDSALQSLLALEGAAFVQNAYALLLGRPVDPTGLAHYLSWLERGVPKSQVIAELALSEEFRQRKRVVRGLDGLMQRHSHLRNPVTRVAMRLARRLQAAARPNITAAAAAPAEASRVVTSLPMAEPGQARPALAARRSLVTLPPLEQRESLRKP